MMVPAAAVAAVLAQAAQEPLHGLWRIEGRSCDRQSAAIEVPVSIDAEGMHFLEHSCLFARIEPIGVGAAVRLELACLGEGSARRHSALAVIDAEDRLLFYWDDGASFVATRCN